MQPPEYYCKVTEQLFTVMFDKLFVLDEDIDDWVAVNWDEIAEDELKNDHYSWVQSKLKKDIEDMIKSDPAYQLFG